MTAVILSAHARIAKTKITTPWPLTLLAQTIFLIQHTTVQAIFLLSVTCFQEATNPITNNPVLDTTTIKACTVRWIQCTAVLAVFLLDAALTTARACPRVVTVMARAGLRVQLTTMPTIWCIDWNWAGLAVPTVPLTDTGVGVFAITPAIVWINHASMSTVALFYKALITSLTFPLGSDAPITITAMACVIVEDRISWTVVTPSLALMTEVATPLTGLTTTVFALAGILVQFTVVVAVIIVPYTILTLMAIPTVGDIAILALALIFVQDTLASRNTLALSPATSIAKFSSPSFVVMIAVLAFAMRAVRWIGKTVFVDGDSALIVVIGLEICTMLAIRWGERAQLHAA